MPMPKPGSGESESDFVSRCMADEVMQSEYPDAEQRSAVCHRQFNASAEIALSTPLKAKVVEERADGSGIVEVPICREHEEFNFKLTSGSGKGKGKITLQMLRQMAVNFKEYPGPVPVGVTVHEKYSDRAGAQLAFIETMSLRGSVLWAQIDIVVPMLFQDVKRGMFRGFSIEGGENVELPAKKFEGWVIYGGIFVNRPAANTHFKIAASSEAKCEVLGSSVINFSLERGDKESEMPDTKNSISLEAHEAAMKEEGTKLTVAMTENTELKGKLTAANQENTSLSAKLEAATTERDTFERERNTANALLDQKKAQLQSMQESNQVLQTSLTEKEAALKKVEDDRLGDEVKVICADAIANGVAPVIFDGFDKGNPAEWMRARYTNMDAFKAQVETLRGLPSGVLGSLPVRSGHDPKKEADPKSDEKNKDVKLTAVNYKGTEVKVDFAGVTTDAEAKERLEAAFEAKQKE